MKQLFGTDGIRGVAGEPPLDPATVRRFGAALAEVLGDGSGRPVRVVLGRDTRESGRWIGEAASRGLGSCGAAVVDAGVITTPGLALVTKREGFDAGVMISASHNPFLDNGLKVFGADGAKLSDAAERLVEERILGSQRDPGAGPAPATVNTTLVRHYVEFLERVVPGPQRFGGLRLVLDCANGAASHIAPEVFRFHGATVETIGAAPDGRNINLNCGSLHLDGLARRVTDGGHDMGIAFDGDADRALAIDRRGRVIDGDHVLFIAARWLNRNRRLRGGAVVATIMSNLWLEKALESEGVAVHRAAVGDKYVLERMIEEDLVLGGEPSGHVIFRDYSTTGDGLLTGLLLLEALAGDPRALESVIDGIRPFPQVLLNVRVQRKPDLRSHPSIGPAVERVEQALAGSGRVILRYSGTEPLARVMVEGPDGATVRAHAEELARTIEQALGG